MVEPYCGSRCSTPTRQRVDILAERSRSSRWTAGTTYFVSLLNIGGNGHNLGTWANDGNGNPQPAGAPTPTWAATSETTGARRISTAGTNYATVNNGNGPVNVAGGEPILFEGVAAVPEPAMTTMLLTGVAMAAIRRRRTANV